MLITDKVTLGDVRVGADGYLEAFARTARTGVQTYLGKEAGRPEMKTVAVYRDETEVFSRKALDTFSKIPVTLDHPAEPVTSRNWRNHAVGTTGDEVLRDGEHLKIGLKITDQAAIDAIQAGKRELSVGYSTELVWQDGVAPDGTPYQAKQTAIVANHVAIVTAGRAGPQCRIGDSWAAFSTAERDTTPMQKHIIDGIPVELSDVAVAAVSKLQNDKAALVAEKDKLVADHAKELATRDASLAKKDAEIDDLKSKVLDGKALDAAVQARGDLIAKAKAIVPTVATDGKSDAEIRHAVVAAKIGDAAVKDKPAAYIDARFDILCEDVKPGDPVRDAINGGLQTSDARATVDKAHAAYVASLTDAWKGDTKGAA